MLGDRIEVEIITPAASEEQREKDRERITNPNRLSTANVF